jgi:uncharacterized protein DUF6869
MSLDQVEMNKIAETWIDLHRLPEDSQEREDKFWSWDRLWELVHDDPEAAWNVIQIISEDGSDRVLANLATGPLEDLLVEHGDQFIDRVEALARRDAQFRKLLGAVWQNSMSPKLWRRIKAVAGPSW